MPPAADGRRRVAHYAAPALFLLAVTIAVLLIRSGLESGSSRQEPTATAPPATTRGPTTTRRTPKPSGARYYTVQSGDTFGAISVKTGVSIARLEQLNPGVSSNGLQVGQKLRVK